MSIGLRLDLRQSQQLVMTPQLQQAIKLLQMSNLELLGFVEDEVEKNPLLEIASDDLPAESEAPSVREDVDELTAAADVRVTEQGDHSLSAELFDTGTENLHDSSPSDGPPALADHVGVRHNTVGGDPYGELPGLEHRLAEQPSLSEHLRTQIGQMSADRLMVDIALGLVNELDADGYLRVSLLELADRYGVDEAAIEAGLALLQACEPSGVGARSVAECLALQLLERNRLDPAMQVLLDNLDLILRGERKRLRQACGVDEEDFADMLNELRTLNPRPCETLGQSEPQTVIPDVLLQRASWGGWQVELNSDSLPRVLMNRTYTAHIADCQCQDTKVYLSECFSNASWLIKSMDQRAKTILKVASEIVRHQDSFFTQGIAGLRPLTLRAVADAVGMHESTVSRVTSNKYISTERGIFELKFFFTNAIGGDDSGLSAETVRHRIKTLVDQEQPDAILSDDTIVELLKADGIEIARRTVAKYRKSLNILSSVDRRRQKAMRSSA